MSTLAVDFNSNPIPAFREPRTGATQTITTVAAASAKTAAALSAGMYRIFIPKTVTGILRFASGQFATVAATATDMPREAGEYFAYINAGDSIAVYDTVGGAVVEITLMP